MENNAANNAPVKEPYMVFDPPAVPTMEADVPGIRYDFNLGLRVSVPQGNYRVRFVDRDAALTVYDAAASGVLATSGISSISASRSMRRCPRRKRRNARRRTSPSRTGSSSPTTTTRKGSACS